MVAIKICGITRLDEIEYVNLLKPEYIGLVFTESKRQVDSQKAKFLCDCLDKSIMKVGVFRNNSLEEILEIVNEVTLDVVQLHGSEDEVFIDLLRENLVSEKQIWKAIVIRDSTEFENHNNIDNYILDGANSGSGERFSWEIMSKKNIHENIFLAGGINEDNVLLGIETFNPRGIDVSSGVEVINEKGQRMKSFEKMERLIRKVRDSYER
ncbi:phosphoribosylanthranilate isomerase [Inconstantimicrobium mannanitabidum]|uniref:N-(5'-phosphoribosyl)anthranilate isomerase n=1 Tax=Inconstantimicrobium mannanitabidum TaxID=1604901 RepID=A0ACB5RDV3_9CLOT|nr:phosphoribosylanthranilate isomerase [Clostridium sp. TW13]GKX67315.1 N-(5'-phosphoribosyl)anthranilate isomerase [Clostridium sp. TW13]